MPDFGGRAMCPADEYADLDLREEMGWHALEQALEDAEMLEDVRWLDSHMIASCLVPMLRRLEVGQSRGGIQLLGHPLRFEATSDAQLGEDATVDLVCTLTGA